MVESVTSVAYRPPDHCPDCTVKQLTVGPGSVVSQMCERGDEAVVATVKEIVCDGCAVHEQGFCVRVK